MGSSVDLPSAAPSRPTSVRYLVLAALLVITAINYVQRNCISPAATTIEESLLGKPAKEATKEELQRVRSQLDLVMGAFFLSYTFFQVPSGWLAQRWGSRVTLPLYAAGWSLALIGCAMASGFAGLYSSRLAMGALQAGIFPCATMILAVWFPATQRGLATALLNSFMLIGSAGGVTLAGFLLTPLGWRGVFFAYAVPGLLWSIWFLWWFRNHPSDHPGVNQAERDLLEHDRPVPKTPAQPIGRAGTLLLVLTSVPLILLCTQQFFRAGANRLFDSRLPTYLEVERLTVNDISLPETTFASPEEKEKAETAALRKRAAVLSSYPQWAGVFGGIAGGALSDHVLRRTRSRRLARNGVAILSLLSASVVYFAAYFVAGVTPAMLVLSAGAFLFCFSSPCAYSLCIDIGGKHLAVVFGMMNMIGNLGAYAFVSSIMEVVNYGGWTFALAGWLAMHFIAVVCWLFLDPNVVIGEEQRKE